MKKILLGIVVFCSIFLLAGCGVNKDMVGKYKGIEMTEGDTTLDEASLKQLGVSFTLEVKDDGTAVLDLAGDKTNLKYDSKYFSDKDSKSEYKYENGKITISSEETSLVFEKEK